MRAIHQRLIAGVCVDGGHQTVLHAERIVKNFHHWHETVSCATGVRNHFVSAALEVILVNAVHDGRICTV